MPKAKGKSNPDNTQPSTRTQFKDPVLDAMRAIGKALTPLNTQERKAVKTWMDDRFFDSV
jgi:hypothetical protein